MQRTKNKKKVSTEPTNRTPTNGQKVRDVGFVFESNSAEHVYLCGDFNDWQPTSLRMIGDPDVGLWEKRVTLPPGRYEYKFNVDGAWVHDPGARRNIPNIFGTLNSVVEVTP
jgi:1,4-alpha-glucan branching enzyme